VTSSYWLSEAAPEPDGEPVDRIAGSVDVAVVGGGVTGCACALALALAEAGLSVRVHEAREIAGGASGRNGGFALRGGAPAYDVARRDLGRERARGLWELTERYVDRLESLARDAFRRTGSLRLVAGVEERVGLDAEYEALREDGFAVEWRDELPDPIRRRFEVGIFPSAGRGASACPLGPTVGSPRLGGRRRAARARARRLAGRAGCRSGGDRDGPLHPRPPARAGRRDRADPRPGDRDGAAESGAPHYARQSHAYWQQTPEGRLVAGGFRDKAMENEPTAEERVTPLVQDHLERFVSELLGETPRITHRWAGIFGIPADDLPLVGRYPGRADVWVSCG
jgi:gamma-glutamylputrescine oxidase